MRVRVVMEDQSPLDPERVDHLGLTILQREQLQAMIDTTLAATARQNYHLSEQMSEHLRAIYLDGSRRLERIPIMAVSDPYSGSRSMMGVNMMMATLARGGSVSMIEESPSPLGIEMDADLTDAGVEYRGHGTWWNVAGEEAARIRELASQTNRPILSEQAEVNNPFWELAERMKNGEEVTMRPLPDPGQISHVRWSEYPVRIVCLGRRTKPKELEW
jgi:hypothetical protein